MLADRLQQLARPTPRPAPAARPRPSRRGTPPAAGATSSVSSLRFGLVGEHALVGVEDVEERLRGEQRQLAQRRPVDARRRTACGRSSRIAAAACAASNAGRRSFCVRASFSRRGTAFSSVWRSARISSVSIVSMSLGGVDPAVDVHHVGVVEHAHDLADRVRLADVGEELVAQPRALGRALDDARDVHERHRGGHGARPSENSFASTSRRGSGSGDDADVGLDRRERVVGGEHVVAGQGVEQGRLADVGQPDDPQGE